MKKIFILVFFLLIFSAFFSVSFAKSDLADAKEQSMTIASESAEEIKYELPYPGLLPDNPLYFLRAIRDRIVGFLISDPVKKAEFDLLQADKRLNAGIFLFDKGKFPLALSTISKAENYFEQALDKIDEAKMQGKSIDEIKNNLKIALKRHELELKSFVQKANKDLKESFENEQKRTTGFEQRLGR